MHARIRLSSPARTSRVIPSAQVILPPPVLLLRFPPFFRLGSRREPKIASPDRSVPRRWKESRHGIPLRRFPQPNNSIRSSLCHYDFRIPIVRSEREYHVRKVALATRRRLIFLIETRRAQKPRRDSIRGIARWNLPRDRQSRYYIYIYVDPTRLLDCRTQSNSIKLVVAIYRTLRIRPKVPSHGGLKVCDSVSGRSHIDDMNIDASGNSQAPDSRKPARRLTSPQRLHIRANRSRSRRPSQHPDSLSLSLSLLAARRSNPAVSHIRASSSIERSAAGVYGDRLGIISPFLIIVFEHERARSGQRPVRARLVAARAFSLSPFRRRLPPPPRDVMENTYTGDVR